MVIIVSLHLLVMTTVLVLLHHAGTFTFLLVASLNLVVDGQVGYQQRLHHLDQAVIAIVLEATAATKRVVKSCSGLLFWL